LDELLTSIALTKSIGQANKDREFAATARAYTVNSMVFNAVIDQDVDLIETIVKRIDGLVPAEEDRTDYANIFGEALDEVLSYESADLINLHATDPVIIAMAKVIVFKATLLTGSNTQARKDRNKAAQIIFERCGGRKTEATRPLLETSYVEPDWMSGLHKGQGDGVQSSQEP